ncbi:MAG: orotidine-5'-phosphate decarboxylase [Actinobacteria bacterium]|nr:MAG: orotidine-5'-phosphate decarboxylase [Actinomycetota bacterium]
MATVAVTHFSDRLAAAVERKSSQLVVGLDPVVEHMPAEVDGDLLAFCSGIVDAIAPYAVAVKPQSAFFEAHGADGVRAFAQVCEYARAAGLIVIADVTVNPYLGGDSVEPFLEACRREGAGIFCLVKTSNPGSADVQDVALADGRKLWQHVAGLVRDWGSELIGDRGFSAVGAVVGATFPREVAEARELLPRSVLLLPGIGAQGGTPADVGAAFAAGPAGALVSASRSVIYAYREGGGDWQSAAGAEAERLAREVWSASGR